MEFLTDRRIEVKSQSVVNLAGMKCREKDFRQKSQRNVIL